MTSDFVHRLISNIEIFKLSNTLPPHPRSPDLTPCEFFLWGFVKEAVYVPSLPTALDGLKNRITSAVNSVTQDILLRVWNKFSYRLDVTRAAGGRHIEHL